jgi:hypothetical protein
VTSSRAQANSPDCSRNLSIRRRVALFQKRLIRLGDHMDRRGTGGRPSKGDRDHIVSRPSRVVGDLIRQRADEAGLSISDYVANVLARAHGLPEPVPVNGSRDQEVLPLGRIA